MAEDIPRTAPPFAVAWRQQDRAPDHHRDGGGRHAAREHARATDAYERLGPPPHEVADALSVQGVPQADLTPAVRRALGQLMGEIDRLRQELEAAREGDGALFDVRERAEHLPLLGARSLERAFRRSMAAAESGPTPAVVFLYAGDYESIRARDGLAAAEAVYHAMAGALARCRRDDEVAGAVGGASVVMLVPFDGHVDRLWARARVLAKAAGAPVPWRSETLRVGVLVGVHVPRPGERPGDAFWQAEQAARRIV